MAHAIRYFSTTGAGAADGTTWADRAALLSSGSWSSIITGWDFATDSLECRIGPGTYNYTQGLTTTTITTDPTAAQPLFLTGCDSSGNILTPPNPTWTSNAVAWDTAAGWTDSNWPILASASNSIQISLTGVLHAYLIKFSNSAATSNAIVIGGSLHWCVVENTASGTSSYCTTTESHNCVLRHLGTSFSYISGASWLTNCRIEGSDSAASGNRRGIESNSAAMRYEAVTVVKCASPLVSTSVSTSFNAYVVRSQFHGAANEAILLPSTASQTAACRISRCVITGNGTYGINAQSGARTVVADCRLRNNTTADFNGLGNYPLDRNNTTSAGTDADEFVDATGGDYRIKYGSAFWGKGLGAGDGPATITG